MYRVQGHQKEGEGENMSGSKVDEPVDHTSVHEGFTDEQLTKMDKMAMFSEIDELAAPLYIRRLISMVRWKQEILQLIVARAQHDYPDDLAFVDIAEMGLESRNRVDVDKHNEVLGMSIRDFMTSDNGIEMLTKNPNQTVQILAETLLRDRKEGS